MASPPAGPADIGTALAGQFDRMVRRDGGSVSLLGVAGSVIRVGYRPGRDPGCDDAGSEEGRCVLPQLELQQLMAETLARRDGSLRVVVELVPEVEG